MASLPGDWDRAKAANITNDILTRNPDLVAIFAANDTMALGAVETVYAAGKGDDVIMVGVDGNVDAVESIKAGRLNASVAQLPYLVGKQAVERVAKVLAGEEVETFQYVDTLVLTKEVLEGRHGTPSRIREIGASYSGSDSGGRQLIASVLVSRSCTSERALEAGPTSPRSASPSTACRSPGHGRHYAACHHGHP